MSFLQSLSDEQILDRIFLGREELLRVSESFRNAHDQMIVNVVAAVKKQQPFRVVAFKTELAFTTVDEAIDAFKSCDVIEQLSDDGIWARHFLNGLRKMRELMHQEKEDPIELHVRSWAHGGLVLLNDAMDILKITHSSRIVRNQLKLAEKHEWPYIQESGSQNKHMLWVGLPQLENWIATNNCMRAKHTITEAWIQVFGHCPQSLHKPKRQRKSTAIKMCELLDPKDRKKWIQIYFGLAELKLQNQHELAMKQLDLQIAQTRQNNQVN